jgi:hypothetical protein
LVPGEGTFVWDGLRTSGQASVDRVAGADVLGQNAHVVDSLRLSGQADNALNAALVPGQGTFVTDVLRLSGQAAADSLADADLLGSDVRVIDALRLSGQADNVLDAAHVPAEGVFASDVARLSGQAAADGVTGVDVLGQDGYVADSLRLSGQAENIATAALADGSSFVSDVLRASGQASFIVGPLQPTEPTPEAFGPPDSEPETLTPDVNDTEPEDAALEPAAESTQVKVSVTSMLKVVLGRLSR